MTTRTRSPRRLCLLLVLPLALSAACGDSPTKVRNSPTGLAVAEPEDYAPGAAATAAGAKATGGAPAKAAGSTTKAGASSGDTTTGSTSATPPRRTGSTRDRDAVGSPPRAKAGTAPVAGPKVNTDCRGKASRIGSGFAVKGQTPPDFTSATVDCKSLTFKNFTQGRPTLVNFYASWCSPCKKEAPDIQDLYESWSPRNKFTVVGVNTQDEAGSPAIFYDRFGWTFPSVWDDGEAILNAWDNKSGVLSTLPVSFWLHSDGTLNNITIGSASRSEMESEVRDLH